MTEINNQFIRASLKWGYFFPREKLVYCYILELFNLTDVSLKIKVPLTERIITSGEKIPQKQWGGSVNGVKGIALDPSGFCSIHLIYLNNPSEGEKISVAVDLLNHDLRLNFKFEAPNNVRQEIYRLVDFQSQDLSERRIAKKGSDEWNALISRVDALEGTLLKVFSRIEILEQKVSMPPLASLNPEQLPQESFGDVMDWLLENESVTFVQLRARLLPLNLLIGSVIADLNEKALDQTGDLALEDDGKQIVVNRSILQQVLEKA